MGVTTSKTKVKIDVSFDNAFIAETMASVHISERDALLERALALGLMAEQHDELGTFLDYAESELNSRVGKLRDVSIPIHFHATGDGGWRSRRGSCLV